MPIFAAFYRNKPVAAGDHLQAHIEFLTGLRARGTVVGNGRLLGGPGGLVLLRAASADDARALLADDPFVVHDLRELEIFEWDVRWAPGVTLGVQDDPSLPVREIAADELHRRLERRDRPALIDVREADEVASGAIDGAFHVPLGELEQRRGELPDGELLFICRGGGRSARACRLLARHGRLDTASVVGGMTAWSRLSDV